MLYKGGNAADVAIATAITLTVVEPTGNGIGSDAFAILWDGKKLHGLNASGRSPEGWTLDRFTGKTAMPTTGWDAVTVPGAVSAWVALSERFGKLPFADLFEPAIRYAADGYLVSPTIARLWARQAPSLKDVPGFVEHFMPHGRAPEAGEKFAAPAHASTLKLIAETKGAAFYRGELAESMAAHSRKHGGAMTMADLAAHTANWVEPLAQDYRGYTLHEIPPNGQGIAAQIALGILENFDLGTIPLDSADSLHLQMEAVKLAFADIYEYVSDADTMRVKSADLLDQAYLLTRSRLIDMKKAQTPRYGVPASGGTVYLTAADAMGMMVSYIQSNYQGFGSGIVVDGISMQNGQPAMSFGVMGGSIQPQAHTQVMVRLTDYHQNPQAASDAPRWRLDDQMNVQLEPDVPVAVIDELKSRGHRTIRSDRLSTEFGRGQFIFKLDDGYFAASEKRTDGQAVGF
jgi:gamma-glutamyltranspeptidase/glutathione hydrolase